MIAAKTITKPLPPYSRGVNHPLKFQQNLSFYAREMATLVFAGVEIEKWAVRHDLLYRRA